MTADLAGRVSGPVYAPGDPGYEPEIAPFNTAVVHTPDLVVRAESAADVVESVRFARERGLRVTVQSTGHTDTAITSGLLVSTRRLVRVAVDPEARTATVGAGARWASVIAAAAEQGLAPVAGSSAVVGVVGYLLGGGLGPLARSHGFSSDHLLGLTVVTGAGEQVEAGADRDPDLLWALRGGKPRLGVVTELRLRLFELRTLYAGTLFFAEEQIEPALRAWMDWTAEADPRVNTSVAIIRVPPLDVIPEPLRGRRVLSLRFAFPGAAGEGERLAAPLRAAAPVHLDALAELPASEIARVHNDPTEPGPSWMSGMLLTHADQELASALLEHVGAGTDTPFVVAEMRHLGAATRHDVEGGSAVGGRGAAFTAGFIGIDPASFETVLPAAADRVIGSLGPWISTERNVNFAGTPRSADHLAGAWPAETLARLEEVRRRYDPDGVFA